MKTLNIAQNERIIINLPNGEVLDLDWRNETLDVDHRENFSGDSIGCLNVDNAADIVTPFEVCVWNSYKNGGAVTYEQLKAYDEKHGSCETYMTFYTYTQVAAYLESVYNEAAVELHHHITTPKKFDLFTQHTCT